MKMTETDKQLVKLVKAQLDADVDRLPPQTLHRLQSARFRALDGSVHPHFPWLGLPRWVTAGGLATVAVAVLTVSLWVAVPTRNGEGTLDRELENLATQEQLELYEDLEFYRWLANGKQVE